MKSLLIKVLTGASLLLSMSPVLADAMCGPNGEFNPMDNRCWPIQNPQGNGGGGEPRYLPPEPTWGAIAIDMSPQQKSGIYASSTKSQAEAEVTGAVMLTKNFNPAVMTWAALFAISMSFVGKFGALLQTIPSPVMGGIMILLFGSIAGIGLKTLMDANIDFMEPRNLCLISITLVIGIGGMSVSIGNFSLQGISLCGVLAIILNFILPYTKREISSER